MDSAPQLHRCTLVLEEDIRALAEFVRSSGKTEGQLQCLLEKHTGIIGALGYCEYFSEYPVYKRDETRVLLERRRRDRIDILAVKESRVLDNTATPYKSPHVIELKKAHEKILDRFEGMRLSDAAKDSLEKLKNYAEWLTTVEENRTALQSYGLNILRPDKYLIMGTEDEFIGRPGLLEALRADCIQTYGVHLLLVEDVLRQADTIRLHQYGSMVECVLNFKAPAMSIAPLILASSGLSGLVMLGRNLLDQKRTVYGNIVVRDGLSEGLVHIPGKRLQPLARRVNIPFANAVVDFSQYRKMWKAVTDGIVVGMPDVAAIQCATEERDKRNTPVREYRQRLRSRREAAYTRQFAESIRKRFPSLPQGEEFDIVAHAAEGGSWRVRRSTNVGDPITFAVRAYARWNYTEYPKIRRDIYHEYRSLRGSERRYLPRPEDVAEDQVTAQVLKVLEKWSKPPKD